jgi:chitin synthase
MFATVFVTIKSVQSEVKKGFKANDLFKNKVFSTLILSMLSTYVLWFVVSFLFFDAWHMFTSFLQYLLLTPTYINVLNVYALCNTHDLSWGTKGSDDAPGGGSAKSGKDDKVKLMVPHPDIQYAKELSLLSEAPEEEVVTAKPDDIKKSYYASVRSGIVMGWIFSNLALCTLVLKAGSIGVITKSAVTEEQAEAKNSGIYLFVVLWSVAALSAFRFVGSLWFLVHRKVSFLKLAALNYWTANILQFAQI